jgi:hypothetical protein
MPILLNNPAHWHLRAQEARLLAAQLEDLVAKQATLKIADEYDRLAVRAAKRMADDAVIGAVAQSRRNHLNRFGASAVGASLRR